MGDNGKGAAARQWGLGAPPGWADGWRMDPAERRWDEHGMQAVFGKARAGCTARPGARRGLLSCDHPFAFMALLGFLCLIGEINA